MSSSDSANSAENGPNSRFPESGPRHEMARALAAAGVVAIVRLPSGDGLIDAARAAARGGCRALEVTLSVPGALDHIAELRKHLPELLIGVGTITRSSEVEDAVTSGAQYVVCPILDRGIIEACHAKDVPVFPGCQTPTEMIQAHRWGADFVKLFPAEHLGPRYIKNVKAPLPELRIVPTGGVTPENAGDWIEAGAEAVGVGSALFDAKTVAAGKWDVLEARALALAEAVNKARA